MTNPKTIEEILINVYDAGMKANKGPYKSIDAIDNALAQNKELLQSCAPDTNRTFGKTTKKCLYCTEPMGDKSVCDCIEKAEVNEAIDQFNKNIEELF